MKTYRISAIRNLAGLGLLTASPSLIADPALTIYNQNFAVVASLSPGVPLSVQRNQVNGLGQDWSLVNAGGYEGFIPTGHVCYGN